MISSVQIDGFRGFDKFEMSGLGRVNLLVGTNNSGKTSVLEAIYLLASAGDPASLWQVLWRRGERVASLVASESDPVRMRIPAEVDVAHLFHGHQLVGGSSIRISAREGSTSREIEYAFAEGQSRMGGQFRQASIPFEGDEGAPSRIGLTLRGSPEPAVPVLPLTANGGLLREDLLVGPTRRARRRADVPATQFISTESLTGYDLVAMWNTVSLTPNEGLVLRALQFLDPDIERIAAQTASAEPYSRQSRGGFIVKRRGSDQPVPIGSLGDGMWRMLAMSIAIVHCRGGFLLVDEIDTGLHYTVMSKMWSLVLNAATELNVQVFATTHSYDCVYSLAQACSAAGMPNVVTVQRIEPGKQRAVPYDEEEITVAASRDIEVR